MTAGLALSAGIAWITASNGRDTRLIMLEDVVYFRADSKYTVVVTAEGESLLRTPLRELLQALDAQRFRQVHRSTIVNLDQVRQVKPHTNGECFLVLDSGAEVKVSRSYRDVVARFVH